MPFIIQKVNITIWQFRQLSFLTDQFISVGSKPSLVSYLLKINGIGSGILFLEPLLLGLRDCI